MEKKPGETSEAYLKRLFAEGDKAVQNLQDNKKDMQENGITGFCKKCSGSIYAGKEHKC